jgi:hypothetical protein
MYIIGATSSVVYDQVLPGFGPCRGEAVSVPPGVGVVPRSGHDGQTDDDFRALQPVGTRRVRRVPLTRSVEILDAALGRISHGSAG